MIKLSSTGEHLWSTYLGGSGYDSGFGISTDGSGNAFITGKTTSSGWVSDGWDTTYNFGSSDAFVVKLGSTGTHLWSTYLGGNDEDSGRAIVCDALGNALVTGQTYSSNWATEGWDPIFSGGYDGFVVKLNSTGTQLWSTYLGGSGQDEGLGIATDASGSALVTGYTYSSGWVSDGWDTILDGNYDAFVVKLSSGGTHLWSTYLGGSGIGEQGRGIATDPSGNIFVTGNTYSSDWISGGWDTTCDSGDGFVVKLSLSGSHVWSTYLGGSGSEYAYGIATDASGNLFVTGTTTSSGWVSGGWDMTYHGSSLADEDGFVVKLSPRGEHVWSSYLGGTNSGIDHDFPLGIATDGMGNVYVAGATTSSDWASGGWDTTYDSSASEGFVAKIRPGDVILSDSIVVGFGGTVGTWNWLPAGRWVPFHALTPLWMVSGDVDGNGRSDVVADFGGKTGIWIYRDTGRWFFIHSLTTTAATLADTNDDGSDELFLSIAGGQGVGGIWKYTFAAARWAPLTSWAAQSLAMCDVDGNGKAEIVADFGACGLWFYSNNTQWQYVHNLNPIWIATGDLDGNGKSDVVVNFGTPTGIWTRRDTNQWQLLHSFASPAGILADTNGDGSDEIVLSVTQTGISGIWEYTPKTARWNARSGWPAQAFARGDLDANGKMDVVVDFGLNGLWTWKNDAVWSRIHGSDAVVTVGAHFVQALMADPSSTPLASSSLVTYADLNPIVAETKRRLSLLDRSAVAALDQVTVELADLSDGVLAETIGNRVLIDRDAAGYGWFVDQTPTDDVEYLSGDRAAASRMDLLTAVMHEMGHTLCMADLDGSVDELMNGRLRVGVRRK